jgi:hypothetical protein
MSTVVVLGEGGFNQYPILLESDEVFYVPEYIYHDCLMLSHVFLGESGKRSRDSPLTDIILQLEPDGREFIDLMSDIYFIDAVI